MPLARATTGMDRLPIGTHARARERSMAQNIGGINGTNAGAPTRARPCTQSFAARRHHRTNERHPQKSSDNKH
eukprot:1699078-Alexandrium_andersonii.AAC.1